MRSLEVVIEILEVKELSKGVVMEEDNQKALGRAPYFGLDLRTSCSFKVLLSSTFRKIEREG